MLRLDQLTVSAGGRELLSRVDWHLRPGERVGLVGRNGTGKSTLLRTLAGLHEQDSGTLHRRGTLRLGYLPQDGVSASEETVWEEARSGMTHILELQGRLEAAVEALDHSPERIEAHAHAEDAFRRAGGYAAEEKIGTVLFGLGFETQDWHRACRTFSGGWQMRIALARMLLSEPDVLLLDEPTNHLDMHARLWLAKHLSDHQGALILVSHDRFVLDRCVTGIVEVRAQSLDRYVGSFSRYMDERVQRQETLKATAEKQDVEAAKLQRFVERFGAKATKAKQAQSRAKRLDKLNAQRVEIVTDDAAPSLRFSAPEPKGAEILKLRQLTAGWGGPLFRDVELDLHRGHRWVLLGPNGCGKSTLLSVLSGKLAPISGQRILGKGIRVGHFEQDQTRALDPAQTGVEVVLALAPFCTELRARSILGALGLSGERALQTTGTLSGGEKARVALAALAAQDFDVLLLDEPTNHLDVVTVGVLIHALAAYTGTIVISSHDRFLVEQLATHVMRWGVDGIDQHEGLQPGDLEPVQAAALRESIEVADSGAGESHKDRKKRLREAERLRKVVLKAEAEVDRLEGRLAEIDEALGETAEPEQIQALLDERVPVNQALETAMRRWEDASEAVDASA